MPNKECTVDETVYELVRQTDTSTACSGMWLAMMRVVLSTPSERHFATC